jgi:hypothetical protein
VPVRSLIFDPQDPTTVYTLTSVGVFKSNDGGASWSNAGLIGYWVVSLAVDPQNPGTLYAATLVDPGDGSGSNELFKSTDGGATWDKSDSGLPTQGPWRTELLPIAAQNTATQKPGRTCFHPVFMR